MTIAHTQARLNLKMRHRILKAATTLFIRKGFAGVSLSDVAKKLQINQSLIYHYFACKEDLWKAIKEPFLENYHQEQAEVIPVPTGLRPFLEQYLSSSLDFWFHHASAAKILRWDCLETPKTLDPLCTAIEQLQREGMMARSIAAPIAAAFLRSAARAPFFAIRTSHCIQPLKEKHIYASASIVSNVFY